ncbi:unnamed protein product [Notodromas monacha]|uniref:Ras-related protein Rab-43 n=1 Tax=Notodromas monacha TaxID=399045 RepID=A0A7R9BZG7_9CRUS|nr:unnamed protein product [Notodromas monacha]CAG0923416.1 unnamed protein product [Notodromas monacha]
MPLSQSEASSIDFVSVVGNSLSGKTSLNAKLLSRNAVSEEIHDVPPSPRPSVQRTKARSLSESSYADGQLRGILKRRQRRASECHSIGEKLSTSNEFTTDFSTDSEDSPREPCAKTVRFSDRIQQQTFRMDSCILGRRAKNRKKAEKRKRANARRFSEGESTDGDEGVDTSLHKSLDSLTIKEEEEEHTEVVTLAETTNEGERKSKKARRRKNKKIQREESFNSRTSDEEENYGTKPLQKRGKKTKFVQKADRTKAGSFHCDSDSGTSICDYLPDMASALSSAEEPFDFLFKIVVIGDVGVGKTCVVHRFTTGGYVERHGNTIGVDFSMKTIMIDGKRVKLQIWDTAGQERFRTITQSYYRSANGVMLMYDVTKRATFLNLQRWIDEVRKYTASQVSVILIGNKCDMEGLREVEANEALALQDQCPEILSVLEVSAKDNTRVDDCFVTLAKELKDQYDGCSVQAKEAAETVAIGSSSTVSKCCS